MKRSLLLTAMVLLMPFALSCKHEVTTTSTDHLTVKFRAETNDICEALIKFDIKSIEDSAEWQESPVILPFNERKIFLPYNAKVKLSTRTTATIVVKANCTESVIITVYDSQGEQQARGTNILEFTTNKVKEN